MNTRQILQTAFRYIEDWKPSPFGRGNTNDMCPYCKNEDTDVIRDKSFLAQWENIKAFDGMIVKVLQCYSCTAIFSHYRPKEKARES